MEQQTTLKWLEETVKEAYLPVWKNQLGVDPSAFVAKVKKTPLTSDHIVATAPIGLSGGFGFGEEGANTPAAGSQKFERFNLRAKDMYVNLTISQKAIELTGSKGAMIDALDNEVKSSYETAKWNVGRALFGDGTGILAKVAQTTDAGTVFIVDDVSKLKEGLIIDIYSEGSSTAKVAGRRIKAINRTSKAVEIYGDGVSLAENDFITVQNSYNREITGLGAIFDDNIDLLYGLKKSEHLFLKPTVVDANGSIDDTFINSALRTAQRDKNGNVDMILCGDTAYDEYVNYLRGNNTRIEAVSHTIEGGFKAIKFIFGNREIDIVNEQFVPTDEMWGVDTTSFNLQETGWKFAELNGAGVFNLMENQSVYRGLLTNYGDLICSNPGGCLKITHVTNKEA